jgi:hypothetical protein
VVCLERSGQSRRLDFENGNVSNRLLPSLPLPLAPPPPAAFSSSSSHDPLWYIISIKSGKVVILLAGRYAGRKAVVVKANDEGLAGKKFGHAVGELSQTTTLFLIFPSGWNRPLPSQSCARYGQGQD